MTYVHLLNLDENNHPQIIYRKLEEIKLIEGDTEQCWKDIITEKNYSLNKVNFVELQNIIYLHYIPIDTTKSTFKLKESITKYIEVIKNTAAFNSINIHNVYIPVKNNEMEEPKIEMIQPLADSVDSILEKIKILIERDRN